MVALQQILHSAVDSISNEFESMLVNVSKKEQEFFDTDIPEDDFTKVLWGADNLDWEERLWNNENRWLYRLQADLKEAFSRGATLEDVLEQLTEDFDTMEDILQRLVMTESTAASSETRRAILKKLGIKYYRFYTRRDERRCAHCGRLHGSIFPISEYEVGVTASPIHPNCRCWEEPVVE